MSQIDSRAGRMAQLLVEGTSVGRPRFSIGERFCAKRAAAAKRRGPTK